MKVEQVPSPPQLLSARLSLHAVTEQVLVAHQMHWGETGFPSSAFPGCGFAVAPGWPAENWDLPAVTWLLRNMQSAPQHQGWCRWIVLTNPGPATLIGGIGAHGPVTPECTEIEIGYSLVPEFHRQGYGTEAVLRFLDWVWKHPGVESVRAHTLPHLTASRRVLEKTGFEYIGDGEEAGTILYRMSRPAAGR